MTLRQPHEDAVLTGEEIAVIRRALAACSQLLGWAGQHGGPELRETVASAGQAAGLSRSPSALGCEVSLAIDCLDFAPAAGRAR
jgi:hypothetical protein